VHFRDAGKHPLSMWEGSHSILVKLCCLNWW
jgi:hypothetical protein